MTQTRNLTKLN